MLKEVGPDTGTTLCVHGAGAGEGRSVVMAAAVKRILLVEDNETTARTLRLFLEAQGYQVDWARDGREAETRFQTARIDLVVLDLMLPDVDGITLCRSIRTRSTVPIVMLTARTREDEIVEGLESGADDYVCKPFGSKALLARIRRCLQRAEQGRQPTDNDGVLRVRDLELDVDRRDVRVGGKSVRLTRSEFGILHRLMRSPGRVFTREQLIEQALGPDFDGLDRTIDTHIWSLRRKIGEPRGRPRLILSEPGVGYRLSDRDAP